MKLLAALCFALTTSVFAQNSKVIPVFMEAVDVYLNTGREFQDGPLIRPEIQKIVSLIREKNISPVRLQRYVDRSFLSPAWPLPADDEFDRWKGTQEGKVEDVPKIALQAFKLDVIKQSDWFGDDIYAYYFITDGVIPTGKVSTIYKGVHSGQSFFFNEVDRAIYPLIGIPSKAPNNHLIVDYGIIESDGDDIKEMQKLSSIIIDIALAVYQSYDPQNSTVVINLRKEIKALADMLLTLNDDDRLVTSSFGYKASELAGVFGQETYVEFKKSHTKKAALNSFQYILNFRLLRD